MAQFEKLQELWQAQTGPPLRVADTLQLTRSLHAYGRRQGVINIVKALVVTALLVWSAAHVSATPRVIAGFALIGLASLSLIVRDWRNQSDIARSDFSAPSLRFIEDRIARLQEQRDPYRRYYWGVMTAVVIGMNLADQRHGLLARAAFSVLPFLGFEAGMWVRRKRFDAECLPLIEKLSAMRRALEERGEERGE
jgi:hypothetical protein